MKQHFTRLRNEQDAVVLAIGEVFGANAVRLAVTEVHAFAFVLGNLGGKRDLGTAFFDAALKCSKVVDMS